MDYSLEIQRILIKKNEIAQPDDRINFIKNAITIADAHNDTQWGFDLRLDLINEESYTSRCTESIPAFAWVLNAYDNDPELFELERIISRYRWIINQAFRTTEVSIAQINEIFFDYKIRLRKHGYSLRSYYATKIDFAFSLNNVNEVRRNMDLLVSEDANSFDYWINELYNEIELALKLNKFDYAAQLERQISEEDLKYPYYPLGIYATFVLYCVLRKKYNKACEYFLKAEECLARIGNDQSAITCIGKLILYLSITDKDMAWRYFERYVNWSIDGDDYSTAFFSMYVLNLLKGKEERVLQVSPRLAWYRADNTYNTSDLYKYYHDTATNLTKRFDKRNGNKSFTSRMKKIINVGKGNSLLAALRRIFGR